MSIIKTTSVICEGLNKSKNLYFIFLALLFLYIFHDIKPGILIHIGFIQKLKIQCYKF